MAAISAALPILLWDVPGAFAPSLSLPWGEEPARCMGHAVMLLGGLCWPPNAEQHIPASSPPPRNPSTLRSHRPCSSPLTTCGHISPISLQDEAGRRAAAAFPPSTHVLKAGFEPQTPWTCPAPINLRSDHNYYQCHFQHEQNNLFILILSEQNDPLQLELTFLSLHTAFFPLLLLSAFGKRLLWQISPPVIYCPLRF